VSDLEIPFIILLLGNTVPHYLLLHSILRFDAWPLTVAITILIHPKLTSKMFPVDKLKIKESCRFSQWLVFSTGAMANIVEILYWKMWLGSWRVEGYGTCGLL
jgi:hypothetical protein